MGSLRGGATCSFTPEACHLPESLTEEKMAQTDHIEGLLAFLLASTRREPTALGSHYDVSNIENNYTLNSDEILSGPDSHHSMKWDYY